MTRWRMLGWVLLVTILTYGSMAWNQFVYEDPPVGRDVFVTWGNVARTFMQPSRYLSEWLWAGSSMVIHLENLGFHLAVVVLVFLLAERLGATGWVVAGLVALHPIMSQAVLYGWERTELLTMIGVLVACLGATRPTRWGVVLILVGAWIALASKENGVIVVALVPITAMVGPWISGWRRHLPWLIAPVLLFASIAVRGLSLVSLRNATDGASVDGHVWNLQMTAAIGRMFRLYLWPDRLSVEHLIPSVTSGIWIWFLLAVVVVFTVVWILDRGRPSDYFGCALVVCALAPRYVLHLPLSFFPEHQWYGPAIGLSFLVGHALEREGMVVVAALVACSLVTHQRVRVWHDNVSLWTNAVLVEPCSPRAHYNLALALEKTGDLVGKNQETLRAVLAATLPACGGQERISTPTRTMIQFETTS